MAVTLAQVSEDELLEMARTLVEAEPAHLFGATEFKIRALVHRHCRQGLRAAARPKKVSYGASGVGCRHCTRSVGYHTDHNRTVQSLCGPILYVRACYYCQYCGQGLYPFDEQAGISRRGLTPVVEQLATLASAVAGNFEKGVDLL